MLQSPLLFRNNGIVFVEAVKTVVNRSWRLSKGRWACPFGGGQVISAARNSRRLARAVPAVHGQPRQRTRTCPPDRQFPSAFHRLVNLVPIWDITRRLAAQPMSSVSIWDTTRWLIAQPLSSVPIWDTTRWLIAQPLSSVPIWDVTRLLIAQPLSCVPILPARSNLLRPVHPDVHQPVERVLRAESFHNTLKELRFLRERHGRESWRRFRR